MENKLTKTIDVAIPEDAKVLQEETEKIDKYRRMCHEILGLKSTRNVAVIPTSLLH